MWFLEHESLFAGKRVWLRPGSQQLFGRTKSSEQDGTEGRSWRIDNKAVSRQHVMLKVFEVQPGDGTKLHTRSQIEITDLSCRQGTMIDERISLKSKKTEGGSIEYEKTVLTGTEHTIRLASGYPPFRIVWQPVVFTYATKENTHAKKCSAKLHAFDIKTSSDFVFGKTTHVVSPKRNLPKVLSGLVAAKHIVAMEFVDAVIEAAAASIEDGEYIPSKLEEDFDTWWPKEKEYISPIGSEPTPRPQEMLEPDESRSELFSGLTFICLDSTLHSNLQDPISGAGGKTLHFDIQPGQTTIEEYVDYVQSVAGQKRRGASNNGKLPVITIRLQNIPEGAEEWASTLSLGVDRALNQRSILQNEILDIILTKDRTLLQQPPTELAGVSSSMSVPTEIRRSMRERTPSSQSRAPSEAPESSAPHERQPVKLNPRKRAIRTKTVSRFTGFDDYEPPLKVRKVEEDTPMEETLPLIEERTQAEIIQTCSAPATQGQAQPHTIDKEEQMATLFPAATEIKRRRAATRAPSASVELEETAAPVEKLGSRGAEVMKKLQRAKEKADKEINVREATRQRIKEEDEKRRAEEEALKEALEGIDISEMKNLAQVEEMDIVPREPRSKVVYENPDEDPRWKREWNGRPNYKQFRRRGVEYGVRPVKEMVSLEEVMPSTNDTIDDFLQESMESSTRSTASRRRQQTVVDSDEDNDSEPEPGFTRRQRATQSTTQQDDVIHVADSGSEDEHVPVERSHRSSGRTQRVIETQASDARSQRSGSKRPAASATSQPASKKGKFSVRDDDSDEEETGFRFKRRG